MRNRLFIFSFALIALTIGVFLYEARAGAPTGRPEHCGFWTSIDAGLSCR